MPKPNYNHFLWSERKKKNAIKEATGKVDSELTLVELALMGDWSDDHNAYYILYGMLRSAMVHLESESPSMARSILEKLLAWGA
ncbi:MAG: hypothetical protein LBI28_12655 [Treponema sp.]|jgi:hypothetical protein|nr:hypothetical protein [Treponema sp.]